MSRPKGREGKGREGKGREGKAQDSDADKVTSYGSPWVHEIQISSNKKFDDILPLFPKAESAYGPFD